MKKTSSSCARSASHWQELVEQSYQTKLSLREFCTEAHVPLQMLYNWRSKLKGRPKATSKGGFTRLQLPSPKPATQAAMIEVALANGRIVRVPSGMVDSSTLCAVLDAAEAKRC